MFEVMGPVGLELNHKTTLRVVRAINKLQVKRKKTRAYPGRILRQKLQQRVGLRVKKIRDAHNAAC